MATKDLLNDVDEIDRGLAEQDGIVKEFSLFKGGRVSLQPYDEVLLTSRGIKRMSFHAYVRKLQNTFSVEKKRVPPKSRMKITKKCNGHRPYPDGICTKCKPPPVTLKKQKFSHVDKVVFENDAILDNFYAPVIESGVQRAGYLIGRYEACPEVPLGIQAVVCAIYVPPQRGLKDEVELLVDKEHQKITNLCEWLGLKRIGWIYTCISNSTELVPSSKECMTAATLQLKYKNYISYGLNKDYGSKFISVAAFKTHTGSVQLFGYQMSNQFTDLIDAQLIHASNLPRIISFRKTPLTRTHYIPDMLFEDQDNVVKHNVSTLHVNHFVVDISAKVAQSPMFTFFSDKSISFAENATDLLEIMQTSTVGNFFDKFTNFQFIKELATNTIVKFTDKELKEFTEIVIKKNGKALVKWTEQSESWRTLLGHYRWLHQLRSGEQEALKVQYSLEEIECFIRSFFDTVLCLGTPSSGTLSLLSLKTNLMLKLSMSDEKIVECLWTKVILEHWVDHAVASFKDWLDKKPDLKSVKQKMNKLQTQDFWSITELNDRELQKTILRHRSLFNQKDLEKSAVSYSEECLALLLEQNQSITNELRFLEAFFQELKDHADAKYLSRYRDMKFGSADTDQRFRQILNHVIGSSADKSQLAALARLLLDEKRFLLSIEFFDILEKFFEKTKMSTETINGIKIARITGSFYAVSKVLPKLLEKNVQEVHFISNFLIEMDQDIRLPGMNIYIRTDRLVIPDSWVIDVSGSNSDHRYSSDVPGTTSSGEGRDGKDGYAGESAGNVRIEAAKLDRKNLTVLANGGAGSDGQKGGNGRDGIDGKSYTIQEFQKLFPPASPFTEGKRSTRVATVIGSIEANLDTVTKAWWSGEDADTWYGVWENIKNVRNNYTTGVLAWHRLVHADYQDMQVYLEVLLRSGVKITFSFECGGHFAWTNCQSYCLAEGSNGTLGGEGGHGGNGGQGGFSGSITINQESQDSSNAGKNGANGDGGKHGKHGKNGWDVGWMDYSCTGSSPEKTWPKWRGEGHDSKLKMNWYSNDNTNTVLCTYRRKVQCKDDYNMTMFPKTLEHPKQRETTVNTSRKTDRDHHANATKKSNITVSASRKEQTVSNIVDGLIASLQHSHVQRTTLVNQLQLMSQDQVKADMTVSRQMEYEHAVRKVKASSNVDLLAAPDHKKGVESIRQQFFSKLFHLLGATNISSEMLDKLSPKDNCCTKMNADRFLHVQTGSQGNFFMDLVQFFGRDVATGIMSRFTTNHFVEGYEKLKKKNADETKKKTKNDVGKRSDDNKWLHVVREFATNNFDAKDDRDLKVVLEKYHKFLQYEEDGMIIFDVVLRRSDRACLESRKFKKLFEDHLKQKPSFASYCHLELYSQMNNLNIMLFELTRDNIPLLKKQFNKSGKNILRIVLDKNGVPHQMKHQLKHFFLERNREQKSRLYSSLLDELLRFSTVKELENYFRLNGLQHIKYVNSDFQAFGGEFDVSQAIEEISNSVADNYCSTNRLHFITEPFIGTNRILRALRDRVMTEGCLISSTELAFFINSIHDLHQVSPFFEELILWIIVSKEQKCWMAESAFLNMENHLLESLPLQMKEKLKRLKDRQVIMLLSNELSKIESASMETLTSVVNRLQEDVSSTVLAGLSLQEWPYILKMGYWKDRLMTVVKWSDRDLEKILHYIASLETVVSDDQLKQLLDIFNLEKANLSSEICLKLFQNLYSEQCFLNDDLLSQLKTTRANKWLSNLSLETTDVRSIQKLVEIMKTNSSLPENATTQISKVQDVVKRTSALAKKFANYTADDIKKWRARFKPQKTSLEEILAVINRSIQLTEGFLLRDTQKLAIVLFLVGGSNNKVLEQVSTGEGKSLIVASVAIIKSLTAVGELRKSVDIITSSSVLAKRDAEANSNLYNMFNLKVGHNCSESVQERTDSYGANQVVYGEITNFQRDYLLDRFYGKNIFGDRKFDAVIVDEVDSMLLDKGNNVLYLSHQIPGFEKLEIVLVYIWQLVNRPVKDQEDFETSLSTDWLRDNVIDNLYKRITREDLAMLAAPGVKLNVDQLWRELIEQGIIDARGRLQFNTANKSLVSKITTIDGYLKNRLFFLLSEAVRKQCMAVIPNFLVSFVEDHLVRWIDNAKLALVMAAGNDYVVDVDRTGMRNDLHANITILDRDTGTDQASSQWEEGLHQFLQLKHGCKLSLMTLKAIFISNVSYFKLYENLFGLTGTLGSHVEMDLLRQIHRVEYFKIPTSRGKYFEEEPPIAVRTHREWLKQIEQETRNSTTSQGGRLPRSVLIICETVECVTLVQKMLEEDKYQNVFAYRREYEHFTVADQPLEPGKIIVATNLAGRGTDIKISDKLRKAGGLHVILTYLPTNKRVEEQAFGRAARSGDPGSGRLVVVSEMNEGKIVFQMIHAKTERDKQEISRVLDVKQHYETRIVAEEYCFEEFNKAYKSMKERLDANVASNVMENLIDQWAFWLDEWKDIIIENGNGDEYKNKLAGFIEKHGTYPFSDNSLLLHHSLRQGQLFFADAWYKTAIKWFDEVIERDPDFSEGAHYYKAYALGMKINWEKQSSHTNEISSFKYELRTAKALFERRSNEALQCSGIVNKMKENFELTGIIQIGSYEEQKQSLVNMYGQFISSIDDALGSMVTADSFNSGVIDDQMSVKLFNKLLKNHLLEDMKFATTPDKEKVEELCKNYGIQVADMELLLKQQRDKAVGHISLVRALESSIKLPSRDNFWEEMLEKKVIINCQRYVIADEDKLCDTFPMIFSDKSKFDGLRKEKFKERMSSASAIISKTIEQVVEAPETSSFFKKTPFLKLLVGISFDQLVEKQVATEVEVADWNDNMETVRFKNFDMLAPSNFDGECIPAADAAHVLAELVKQEVLSKFNDNYILKGNIQQIYNLQLQEPLNIYTPAVQSVLLGSFAYRLAYKKIRTQRDDKSWPMKIQLMHKPHQELLWDMVDVGIVLPVKTKNGIQVKDEVENLFPEYIPHDQLLTGITNAVPKLKEEKTIQLLKAGEHLKEAVFSETYGIADKVVGVSSNSKVNDQLHLYLRGEMLLRKESTKAHLTSVLEHLKGFLLSLEVPKVYKQGLYDALGPRGYALIEELNIFLMNGLGELIRFKEKPWTVKMLLQTSFIVVLGLCQIVIGVAIQLCSVGLMTNVGSGFLCEGVGDLMFAVSALRSGYFSWSSYLQHKKESIMFTVVTCGVGAFFSRGAQVSRYGSKIVANGVTSNGKAVAEMCGKELIKEVGWGAVGKAVLKDVGVNALKGVAFGLASSEVSRQIDSNLQALCNGMAVQLLTKLEETTANHKISKTVEKVYSVIGPKAGKQLIDTMTEAALADENFNTSWAATFLRFANPICRGIGQGLQKKATAGLTPSDAVFQIAKSIGQVLDDAVRIKNVTKFATMVDKFLNDLDRNLQHSGKMIETKSRSFTDKEELRLFKMASMNTIQGALKTRAGEIVAKKFVEPIMQAGATLLVTYVGSQIKKQYQSYRDRCCLTKFNEDKARYMEEKNTTTESGADEKTIQDIEEKYQTKLNKFKESVRDPKLYAEIIREGGFMDSNCMKACASLLNEKLAEEGSNKGYTIVIRGKDGLSEIIQCGNPANSEEVVVHVTDKHFTIKDSEGRPVATANNRYDCMMDALAGRIPEVESMKDGLRSRIADRIETDENIGNSIRQRYHAFTLRRGMFGGKEARRDAKYAFEIGTPYRFSDAFDTNLYIGSEIRDGAELNTETLTAETGQARVMEATEATMNKLGHIVNGLKNNKALKASLGDAAKINATDVISNLEKYLSSSSNDSSNKSICMGDFTPTMYAKQPTSNGVTIYVPVEWEMTMNFTLPLSNQKYTGEFDANFTLNFDNPSEVDNGPKAPQVGYSIRLKGPDGCPPLKRFTGHSIMNPIEDQVGRTRNGLISASEVQRKVKNREISPKAVRSSDWMTSRQPSRPRCCSLYGDC